MSIWSKDEINILQSSNGIEDMKFKLPNKTEKQIRAKAGKLKLSVAKRDWSNEDIDYLIINYETLGATKVAEALNKKVDTVRHKAKSFNLKFIPYHEKVDTSLAIRLYHEFNIAIEEIAKYFHVHYEYIRKLIPEELKRYRLNINMKELVNKYENGIGTTLLAKEYNTYPTVIKDILNRNGIKLREHRDTWNMNKIEISINEIVDLYNYGFSLRQIASMYKVSDLTIKERILGRIEFINTTSFYTSGSKNNNWKGGVTPEHVRIRQSEEYKTWRISSFKRDNYTCQCCNDSKGGNLQAHHIENFSDHEELRFDITNAITLCNSCHNPNVNNSFHHMYGTRNNTLEQLQEYFDMKRTELNLPLVSIKEVVNKTINTELQIN